MSHAPHFASCSQAHCTQVGKMPQFSYAQALIAVSLAAWTLVCVSKSAINSHALGVLNADHFPVFTKLNATTNTDNSEERAGLPSSSTSSSATFALIRRKFVGLGLHTNLLKVEHTLEWANFVELRYSNNQAIKKQDVLKVLIAAMLFVLAADVLFGIYNNHNIHVEYVLVD